MQFALVGDHPDGIDMARALAATGRHELLVCNGVPPARRSELPGTVKSVGDFEEVLADPQIDMVIVAGPIADRPAQLRRVLQSERHALCVYPPDYDPDIAYEAALIQGDTKKVLLPLLPAALHPAVTRLREHLEASPQPVRLLHLECWRPVGTDKAADDFNLTLPEWNVLRALGGEIAEVSAFAADEEVVGGQPVLISGRFERGMLFQITVQYGRQRPDWRLSVFGERRLAVMSCDAGLTGPGRLELVEGPCEPREELWPGWDPGPELVKAFESALAGQSRLSPNWQDAIRCLELDDAARRSIQRRRASLLEYPEATEEVGFKGTMTLVGCAVLWGSLVLLIISNWFPRAGLVIAPVLVLFLILQLLRWLIPGKKL